MAPTVARDGQFRMFFFSREKTRIHTYTGLSKRQLREAEAVVVTHLKEIQDAWNRHFGS